MHARVHKVDIVGSFLSALQLSVRHTVFLFSHKVPEEGTLKNNGSFIQVVEDTEKYKKRAITESICCTAEINTIL